MDDAPLSVNVPKVVHETIDGETIVIHMGTGTYYSLEGTAAEVWALVGSGLGRGAVVAGVRHRFDGDAALVEPSVFAFLDELIAEGLIVAGASTLVAVDAPAARNGSAPARFEPPVLRKYTDMQEFMLVDPLHEVDAGAGWPHAQAG
jgi:Coenzyme PQQ synthesis protein D (PqqD)